MVDVVALGETMVQFNAVTTGPLRYVTRARVVDTHASILVSATSF